MSKLKLVHVINSLDIGGAESMLEKLLANTDQSKFDLSVVTLMDGGSLKKKIEAHGVPIYSCFMSRNPLKIMFGLIRLVRIIRNIGPNIIQTWMYHPNLLVFLISFLFPQKTKLYWNIRSALHVYEQNNYWSFSTRLVIYLGSFFSRYTSGIIINTNQGLKHHLKAGYCKNKFFYIPNGFNEEYFQRQDGLRKNFRKTNEIEENEFVIGFVGRFHRDKGPELFLDFAKNHPQYRYLMVGPETDSSMAQDFVRERNLLDRVILLSSQSEMNQIYSGIDMLLITSETEGFSNTLAESMLCGVLPLAVDVGENKNIIQEEFFVSSRNLQSLQEKFGKIENLTSTEKEKYSAEFRESIIDRFSIKNIAKKYEEYYLRT
ncbi:glycosyltransferase [Bacteriovoracaceae bacterium]|nr:glycosyltransferase [Bacteriovoracaceae bacterium]